MLVEGRVQRTVIQREAEKTIVYNIHNYGIQIADRDIVFASIASDQAEASDNPFQSVVIVAGDFNNLARGESRHYLTHPMKAGTRTSDSTSNDNPWQQIFENFTEVHQNMPTHYVPGNSSMGRLDRIYITTPPWILQMVKATCSISESCKTLYDSGISDHSAVSMSIGLAPQLPPTLWPIPKYVFDNPEFIRVHEQIAAAADLDNMPVTERWRVHKEIIREAVQISRNGLLRSDTNSPFVRSQILTSAARCVWYNNVTTAMTLIQNYECAAEHLHVVKGKVEVRSPESFESAVCAAKLEFYEYRKEELSSKKNSTVRKSKHQIAAIDRLCKLWSPKNRKFCLAGIRTGNGKGAEARQIITEPQQRAAALAEAWSATFSKSVTFDVRLAEQILQQHCVPFDCSNVCPPNVQDYVRSAKRAKHTSPGLDGIPNAAWSAAGHVGAKTLFLVGGYLMEGYNMPLDFNSSLSIFVPKGEDPMDDVLISREATDTRPLGLKNSDNKLIGGVQNDKMKPALSKGLCKLQRGFCPDRQLVQNVLDLDTASRVHSMASPSFKIPILAFWDFAAAFPSVFHAWVLLAVQAYQLPLGLVELIRGIYFMNMAYLQVKGTFIYLYMIVTGVLQGCPLSGMIFDIGLDPFLRWMEKDIERTGLGTIRACADDIGGSLSCISALSALAPVFECAQRVAGLTLKPIKCVIVPLKAFDRDCSDIPREFTIR